MENDPIPAVITAYAAKREGKPITKRDRDALEAAHPGLRVTIRKAEFTGTAIEWYAETERYDRDVDHYVACPEGAALVAQGVPDSYRTCGTIYLSRLDTHAVWPTVEELRTRNASYYSARDERNAARTASLAALAKAQDNALRATAIAIDEIKLMAHEFRAHLESLPAEVARVAVGMLADARTDMRNGDDKERHFVGAIGVALYV